jgi:hypothetical protein
VSDTPSVTIGPFKVGEKPSPMIYSFQDSAGVAINLTAYTVKFNIRERESAVTAVFTATLLNGPLGQVQYSWTGAEFPTPGHWLAEFWVGNGTQRWASLTIKFDVAAPVGPVPPI